MSSLNIWERALVECIRRNGRADACSRHLSTEVAISVKTALAEQATEPPVLATLAERMVASSRHHAFEPIPLMDVVEFGAATLTRWFRYVGFATLLSVLSLENPRVRVRLRLKWPAESDLFEADVSLCDEWSHDVGRMLIAEASRRALTEKSLPRHVGMAVTALAMGRRFGRSAAPRFEPLLDPHVFGAFMHYLERAQASRLHVFSPDTRVQAESLLGTFRELSHV